MGEQSILKETKFDAFLSYSRRDIEFADKLEKTLEKYNPPKIDGKKLHNPIIFRDAEDLEGGGDYHVKIDKKIAISNKLIVLCSPNSRKSTFVNDEIRRFAKKNSPQNIIPILVSGKPNNEIKKGEEHLMAFPEALVEVLPMPLAINYEGTNWREKPLNKGLLRGAWFSILSALYDISRDIIEQRDYKKRKRRFWAFTTSAFLITSAIIALSLMYAITEKKKKETEFFSKNFTKAKIYEEKAGRASQEQTVTGYQKAWLFTLAALKQDIHSSVNLNESKNRLARKAISSGANIDQQIWVSPVLPDNVSLLTTSPSGNYMATASGNGKLRLWDIRKGEEVLTWMPHDKPVTSLIFSGDENYLVSAAADSTIKIWNIDQIHSQKPRCFTHSDVIRHLAISPDNSRLAFSTGGRLSWIWKTDQNFLARWFGSDSIYALTKGQNKNISRIEQMAFSRNGKHLVFLSDDGRVLIREAEDDASSEKKYDPPRAIQSIALSSSDDLIACGLEDGTIHLRNFREDTTIIFPDTLKGLKQLTFNRPGRLLAAASDKQVFIWKYETHDGWRKMGNQHNLPDSVKTISFQSDSVMVTYGSDQHIRMWNFLSDKTVATTTGHGNEVNCVAFHPVAGTALLASGADDGTVILWDIKNGAEKGRLEGASGVIESLQFNSDGRLLAAGVKNGNVIIWNVNTKKIERQISDGLSKVWDVAFSPNDSMLAIAQFTTKNNVQVYHWNSGATASYEGHNNGVRSIAFSPDGSELAAVSNNGTAIIWDVKTTEKIIKWRAHQDKTYGISWNPDGSSIATASSDETIHLWDYKNLKKLLAENYSDPVRASFPQGEYEHLFNSLKKSNMAGQQISDKLEIRFSKKEDAWNIPNGERLLNKKTSADSTWQVAFSLKKRFLAYRYLKRNNGVIDLELRPASEIVKILRGHLDEVWDIAFSPDNNLLASGAGDNIVRIWHVQTGVELARLEGHTRDVFGVSFSSDSKVLASASFDHSVRLWDMQYAFDENFIKTFDDTVRSVTVSSDGKYLAYGGHDQLVHLDSFSVAIDSASLKRYPLEVPYKKGAGYPVLSLAFNRKNDMLAYGTADDRVHLWDVQKSKSSAVLNQKGDPLTLAFHPDSAFLACGSSDGKIRIWKMDKLSDDKLKPEILDAGSADSKVRSIVFNPDGSYLAAGYSSSNKSIILWKRAPDGNWTGRQLGNHSDGVWSVSFSPNGRYLASASWDNSIRLWDIESKERLFTLRGHRGPVTSIVFLNDSTLASGSWDATIRLWDRKSGNELDVISAHKGPVYSLAASPGGRYLISGSADRSMRIHEIIPTDERINKLNRKQFEQLFAVYKYLLPIRMQGDNLLDSDNKYFLRAVNGYEFPGTGFSSFLRSPRPQGNQAIDWVLNQLQEN